MQNKSKRTLAGGARGQAECRAADRVQMGAGVVRPRFGYAYISFGRARNSREHTARRECRKAGSGRAESDMRKARGDKFAARAKKNREKSGASLPVHCALCSDGACLGGADSLKQPVSRLEFRRPGDGGFRHCLSCVLVAVCPICADSFCRFARRSLYDAKEMICLICPLPIGRGIFRVENAAGCGIIKAGNQ